MRRCAEIEHVHAGQATELTGRTDSISVSFLAVLSFLRLNFGTTSIVACMQLTAFCELFEIFMVILPLVRVS